MAISLPASGSVNLGALQGPQDPDWPCIQRLVPEIAAAQLWRGPPVDAVEPARDDPALRALAEELAARRVPLEDAGALAAQFAEDLDPAEKGEELTRLFAETLTIINEDRNSIIDGIRRYARGQRELADRIAQINDEIQALPKSQVIERQQLIAERDWDVRVFDDRRHALSYLCEQPVLLEQRAFALARTMTSHLE